MKESRSKSIQLVLYVGHECFQYFFRTPSQLLEHPSALNCLLLVNIKQADVVKAPHLKAVLNIKSQCAAYIRVNTKINLKK